MKSLLKSITVIVSACMLFMSNIGCASNTKTNGDKMHVSKNEEADVKNEKAIAKENIKKGEKMIKELSKTDFINTIFDYQDNKDWKYKGDKPAIIDFFATWCGPCKVLSPTLAELAVEYDGSVAFYKVDVDKADDLARDFGIRSVPTLLFIPMDGRPQMVQGALPKSDLIKMIEQVFKIEKK